MPRKAKSRQFRPQSWRKKKKKDTNEETKVEECEPITSSDHGESPFPDKDVPILQSASPKSVDQSSQFKEDTICETQAEDDHVPNLSAKEDENVPRVADLCDKEFSPRLSSSYLQCDLDAISTNSSNSCESSDTAHEPNSEGPKPHQLPCDNLSQRLYATSVDFPSQNEDCQRISGEPRHYSMTEVAAKEPTNTYDCDTLRKSLPTDTSSPIQNYDYQLISGEHRYCRLTEVATKEAIDDKLCDTLGKGFPTDTTLPPTQNEDQIRFSGEHSYCRMAEVSVEEPKGFPHPENQNICDTLNISPQHTTLSPIQSDDQTSLSADHTDLQNSTACERIISLNFFSETESSIQSLIRGYKGAEHYEKSGDRGHEERTDETDYIYYTDDINRADDANVIEIGHCYECDLPINQNPQHPTQHVEKILHVNTEDCSANFANQGMEVNVPNQSLQPIPQDYSALFEETLPDLKLTLPNMWLALQSKDGLHLLMFSWSPAKMTQRSVFISNDGTLKIYVHGHELKRDHLIFQNITALNFDEPAKLRDCLLSVVAHIRLMEICQGVPEERFKLLWHKFPDCHVDTNNERETKYIETCRSKQCEWIVQQTKKRCTQCRQVFKNFTRRIGVALLEGTSKVLTPKKFKPHYRLSSPEKLARLKRTRKDMNNVRRQLCRKKAKLRALITEEGVTIGKSEDQEMLSIVKDAFSHSEDHSLEKLFLEQQIIACKRKSTKGMVWHPLIIRLALQIRMISASAYNVLRTSGFVKLPSERLLFDYSHIFEAKPGVNLDVLNDVAKEVATFKHPYQSYHVLMSDEVTISKNLVQRKFTGELIGYCNLTDVQQEMIALEEKVKTSGQGLPATELKNPPIATKMQAFMIKGTASGVCAVVAAYPVSSSSSCDLYDYVWEVVEACEFHNLKIVSNPCDGGSINRAFFDLNPPCTVTESGVVFDTINLYAPHRRLYFISDHPHLVKTARNCLYFSGRKKSRKMKKKGENGEVETLTWEPIVKLFNEKKDMTLKKLHKLTAASVYLNSYSIMNVKLAVRVVSKSTANALKASNWPNTKELSFFKRL